MRNTADSGCCVVMHRSKNAHRGGVAAQRVPAYSVRCAGGHLQLRRHALGAGDPRDAHPRSATRRCGALLLKPLAILTNPYELGNRGTWKLCLHVGDVLRRCRMSAQQTWRGSLMNARHSMSASDRQPGKSSAGLSAPADDRTNDPHNCVSLAKFCPQPESRRLGAIIAHVQEAAESHAPAACS